MEWMLQVVDDIDDLLIAGRQRCVNVLAELGAVSVAVGGVAALGGTLALGVDPTPVGAAAVCVTLAALLRARSLS